jgi:hypothetical protein
MDLANRSRQRAGSPVFSDPMIDAKPDLSSRPQQSRFRCRPGGCAGPSLTFRAVGVGLLVGTLLRLSNMYFGLQTGWVPMGSLQVGGVGMCRSNTLDRV